MNTPELLGEGNDGVRDERARQGMREQRRSDSEDVADKHDALGEIIEQVVDGHKRMGKLRLAVRTRRMKRFVQREHILCGRNRYHSRKRCRQLGFSKQSTEHFVGFWGMVIVWRREELRDMK